jgi:hypothetical protein
MVAAGNILTLLGSVDVSGLTVLVLDFTGLPPLVVRGLVLALSPLVAGTFLPLLSPLVARGTFMLSIAPDCFTDSGEGALTVATSPAASFFLPSPALMTLVHMSFPSVQILVAS